jgi:hypothetical protein
MGHSMPPVPIYGTWTDFIQVVATDDHQPADLACVTEVIVRLIDTKTGFSELTLSKTNGDVAVTPALGLIEWEADVGLMGTLRGKLYQFLVTVDENETNSTIVLLNTPLSITDSGGTIGGV